MFRPEIVTLGKKESLLLENDGKLSLFWVGTGSAFSKKLFQTNLLIIKGKTHLLIDCGNKCSLALEKYSSSITKIENLFITHSHADHIGGLEEMALFGRYFLKRKPKIIIPKEYEDILWHYSLKGGCGFNEIHDGKELNFSDYFIPVTPAQLNITNNRVVYNIDFEEINIKIYKVKHIPDNALSYVDSHLSYGILINEEVIFTADMRYDPELINNLLENYPHIKTIFHDCQLFEGGVHCSYNELLNLPQSIRNITYLTHYNDTFNKFEPQKDHFAGFTLQGSYYNF